jgi:lipooligosaccharide transport system permease protein
MATTGRSAPRLRAVELTAFAGVFTRETTLFRRVWPSSTFGAIVEPTINLIAFGFGLGALVSSVQGIPYVQFVGTGTSTSPSSSSRRPPGSG